MLATTPASKAKDKPTLAERVWAIHPLRISISAGLSNTGLCTMARVDRMGYKTAMRMLWRGPVYDEWYFLHGREGSRAKYGLPAVLECLSYVEDPVCTRARYG